MAAEVTMICVDNSGSMCRHWGGWDMFKAQLKAIRVYCDEKLKAHPKNIVGIVGLGDKKNLCPPTRNINKILPFLKGLVTCGPIELPFSLVPCLVRFRSSDLPKRRLLMFVGGNLSMSKECLEKCAMKLKEFNVALDVVNFGLQGGVEYPTEKQEYLEAFVASMNDDGNSRYLYAPTLPQDSLTQQLKRSPIMPCVERNSFNTIEEREPDGMKKDRHELAVSKELR